MIFLAIVLISILIIELIHPLVKQVKGGEVQISDLRRQVSELESRLEESSKDVDGRRMESAIDTVNNAVSMYFNTIEYDVYKAAIERAIGVSEKDFSAMEDYVNLKYDGIIRKLRDEVPSLPEDDICLVCYLYAGLSYQSIRLLTDETISNLYSRKSRLLAYIQSSGASDKDLFIKLLKQSGYVSR